MPEQHPVWDGGWHRAHRRVPSPNFGPRPLAVPVDLIVVHSISLPPGVFGSGAIEALFTNTLDWDAHAYYQSIRGIEVSAHFVVARSGDVTQYVDVWQRAWHAGASRHLGRANCNDFSVGIELEGLENENFEPEQYAALAQLGAELATLVPIAHITGHEHVAPGRKHDPGSGFNWSELKRAMAVRSQDRSEAWTWCAGTTA
jgi:N-acetyl-anhydromuramyl-L-alanine amidase AmpD